MQMPRVEFHGIPEGLLPGVYGSDYIVDENKTIHVRFVPNKSHLDSIYPIAIGMPGLRLRKDLDLSA